jgi:endoglucanase
MRRILAPILLLAAVLAVAQQPASAATSLSIEAESMTWSPGVGATFADASASARTGVLLWSNGKVSTSVTSATGVTGLAVTARGDHCLGGPMMVVSVNGKVVSSGEVRSTSTWGTRSIATSLPAGTHRIEVAFTNDHLTASCDRNLRLDKVVVTLAAPTTTTTSTTTTSPTTTTSTTTTIVPAAATAAPPVNPLAERPFHVSSWTAAGHAASQIRSTRPLDAADLDVLAATPTARWFGEWSGDVRAAADRYVSEAAAADRMPVLVAYAIPHRDCSSYSGGGASSPEAYRQWVRDLAAGIGTRRATVILEPDALALADCLSPANRAQRYQLLSDAIAILAAAPATIVYLDAGHANWLTPTEAASRLQASGVSGARGVALNVSNFGSTADQVAYARALHDRLGVHAVIDTSRNGRGSDGTWCNPPGRSIGPKPTTATAHTVVDAYLWIKVPGESDGPCNGWPGAGQFWTDGAVALVRNAS